LFLIGALSILAARSSSRNIAFFYTSGSVFGFLLVLGLLSMYLFHRMQSRTMLVSTAVLGTAVPSAWLFFRKSIESAVLEALSDPFGWSTGSYVSLFVVALGCFVAFYSYSDPVPRQFFLLEIVMTLIGGLLVLLSVQSSLLGFSFVIILITIAVFRRTPDPPPVQVSLSPRQDCLILTEPRALSLSRHSSSPPRP
jgi:hypothetical protein